MPRWISRRRVRRTECSCQLSIALFEEMAPGTCGWELMEKENHGHLR